MMSNEVNQKNKENVWGFWQKLNHAEADDTANVIQSYVHEDISWKGPHPINHLQGADALITGFWQPLLQSFPDLKRKSYIFMGGQYAGDDSVSATGYFTGTFVQDWLGIPATGDKTNIRFGEFCFMQDGKIVENYVQLDLLAVMRQAGFQVIPPAPGAEGGKVPGPRTGDGVLLTEQDELESRKSVQLVEAMAQGLRRYDRKSLSSMEQVHYWHPQMHWYGPCGIGTCHSLEEFEDFHQRPWLRAFPDRPLRDRIPGGPGRVLGRPAEGHYVAGGVYGTWHATHAGEYLGYPATGKRMTTRVMDWWRREGDSLVENWVMIDIIDIFQQFGVDLFDRMRRQVEQRSFDA
ncbi:MAG: ester cyclase [Anaerolineales bacterium]|nr:ester cyclase [Anaerolineales bacterium]